MTTTFSKTRQVWTWVFSVGYVLACGLITLLHPAMPSSFKALQLLNVVLMPAVLFGRLTGFKNAWQMMTMLGGALILFVWMCIRMWSSLVDMALIPLTLGILIFWLFLLRGAVRTRSRSFAQGM